MATGIQLQTLYYGQVPQQETMGVTGLAEKFINTQEKQKAAKAIFFQDRSVQVDLVTTEFANNILKTLETMLSNSKGCFPKEDSSKVFSFKTDPCDEYTNAKQATSFTEQLQSNDPEIQTFLDELATSESESDFWIRNKIYEQISSITIKKVTKLINQYFKDQNLVKVLKFSLEANGIYERRMGWCDNYQELLPDKIELSIVVREEKSPSCIIL